MDPFDVVVIAVDFHLGDELAPEQFVGVSDVGRSARSAAKAGEHLAGHFLFFLVGVVDGVEGRKDALLTGSLHHLELDADAFPGVVFQIGDRGLIDKHAILSGRDRGKFIILVFFRIKSKFSHCFFLSVKKIMNDEL